MHADLTFVGCSSMPNIPPSLPGASLVPGSEDCSYVVRGDNAVWWVAGSESYNRDLVKTDPQSHEVLARIRLPAATFGAYAAGFDAVWATHNFLDKVFRIDPDSGAIVATIPVREPFILAAGEGAVLTVVWDATPAQYFGVVQMVVAKETVWAFTAKLPSTFFDREYHDYALAEIDIKTNTIRSVRQLGSRYSWFRADLSTAGGEEVVGLGHPVRGAGQGMRGAVPW